VRSTAAWRSSLSGRIDKIAQAAVAQSADDLCRRLAARVPNDRERAEFLADVRGL
jgi:hypothetical protein